MPLRRDKTTTIFTTSQNTMAFNDEGALGTLIFNKAYCEWTSFTTGHIFIIQCVCAIQCVAFD